MERESQRGAEVEQPTLFGDLDELASWYREWVGMPEFVQEDLESYKSLVVHFENRGQMEAFAKLVGQTITYRTRSIYYPPAEIGTYADKRYADEP